jgi:hypothetical protein
VLVPLQLRSHFGSMDKPGRAELLRACYYAKHSRRPVVERSHKLQEPVAKGWRNWSTNFAAFGEVARDNDAKWIETPDPKRRTVPCIKRNAGVPALTRIAAKAASKKLKRRYSNAESLLADHVLAHPVGP